MTNRSWYNRQYMENDQPSDTSAAPVAYDTQGRPLYAQPMPLKSDQPSHVSAAPETQPGYNFDPRTRVQYANEPGVRQVTRPMEPSQLPISEELQQKAAQSRQEYPGLNLSDGEYVILAVRRHPIWLIFPVGSTLLALILIFGLTGIYSSTVAVSPAGMPAAGDVILIAILLALLITIFGYFATWIYMQNRFYLTNESVVQEIQHSLFSKREQTVSLGSIEDASFNQTSFIQTLFNYGTIRLSTEGDETTYRFPFVSQPKEQIAKLNNAIEAFKNGRPVDDDMN